MPHTIITIDLTVTEDEAHLMPPGERLPQFTDPGSLHVGDSVIIGRSCWLVAARVWSTPAPDRTTLRAWLLHNPTSPFLQRKPQLRLVPPAPTPSE